MGAGAEGGVEEDRLWLGDRGLGGGQMDGLGQCRHCWNRWAGS